MLLEVVDLDDELEVVVLCVDDVNEVDVDELRDVVVDSDEDVDELRDVVVDSDDVDVVLSIEVLDVVVLSDEV